MSDYLALVTDFVRETALSGGSAPDSIANATGDQAKAAYWINQANLQIQREWINWDFLWRRVTVNLTEDSQIVPSATETINSVVTQVINSLKTESLAILDADGVAHFPAFEDWNNSQFASLYTYETQAVTNYPGYWSMRPDRVILLSAPIESAGMTAIYDYRRKPKALVNDADKPLIPDDFQRLIVVGAKIMYAEHEDAPEVSAGSHEEYDFLLSEMEAAHLPDQMFNRESHSDADLVVVPE